MNRTPISRSPRIRRSRRIAPAALALSAAAAALSLAAAGCAKEQAFSVNGQVVTKDEYIKMLERQTVVSPGGGATTGIKQAIDQIVGDKIILAEASKLNVLPTEDEVQRYYKTQKALFEQTNPGKDYEKAMADEGTTPDEVREQMKNQMAQMAVYAKKLNVTDSDIQQAYNSARGGFGLPARVQLRLIVPTSQAEYNEAKKSLASKTADFNAVADKINPPTLKPSHGLLPQTLPTNGPGMSPDTSAKIQQTAEGAFFGPIDFRFDPRANPVKAWVKVEKKLPGYTIALQDAAALVRAQLVQEKLRDPASLPVRDELIKDKLNATFTAAPKYMSVWNALKTTAGPVLESQMKAAEAANAGAAGTLANPPGAAAATTTLTK